MTLEASPVDCFDRSIDHFRSIVRARMPFTFIAYRSLIPERGDDWYYLSQKVAWFVFVLFNVVDFAIKSFSPVFILLPFVPMVFDAIWNGHQSLNSSKNPLPFPDWLKSIQIIGFVAFSAMGIALLFQKVRP